MQVFDMYLFHQPHGAMNDVFGDIPTYLNRACY